MCAADQTPHLPRQVPKGSRAWKERLKVLPTGVSGTGFRRGRVVCKSGLRGWGLCRKDNYSFDSGSRSSLPSSVFRRGPVEDGGS